jgi:hypothetical protein
VAIYYPRWILRLTVPVPGGSGDETVTLDMPLTRFALERNDHTEADVLEATAVWSIAGIDPRQLTDGQCAFHLASVAPGGELERTTRTQRFTGIMRRCRVRRGGDQPTIVSMLFHDWTSIFLSEKPFVTKGIPDYGQNLSGAWARICDHVGPTDDNGQTKSVVTFLRNVVSGDAAAAGAPGLVFEGEARDVVLGSAVADRFRGDPIGPKITDAWAVWQQCVGMCGLISFVRQNQVVVTTATDYYSERLAPRLIFGKNLRELEEERDVARAREGIIVTSFDPMTGTTIEAFDPPIGDSSVRKRVLTAKAAKSQAKTIEGENRVAFAYPGVTDPGRLLAIAQRIREERSRQEFVARASTGEMAVPAATGDPSLQGLATEIGLDFDLCDLGAGEQIRVEIESQYLSVILGLESDEARVERLVDYGYDPSIASLLVRNLARFASLSPKFFTQKVHVTGESSPEGGSFEVGVQFCNRINLNGSAT